MSKPVFVDLDFGGGLAKLVGLPQSIANGQAVVHEQLLAAIEGVITKPDVDVASTGNINLAAPGATIDGVTMTTSMRFLAKDQTTQAQNGVYVWNGASTVATRAAEMNASAEFNGAVVSVKNGNGTYGGKTFRQTTVNPTVGTTAILFTPFGTGSGPASEASAGVAELATQAEADGGTDDERILTAYKAKRASWMLKKGAANIGDASATQFVVTHNLGTRDVDVTMYRNSGAYDEGIPDIEHTDINSVTIRFNAAPAANAWRIVVIG